MDNYYDPASGQWVTDWDRYNAVARQPRFADLDTLLFAQPDRAWTILLDLLASVPDDTIHYVGAGPLESFIRKHGFAFIAELEAEAHSNSRFRRAAIEVNLERKALPAPIEQRLVTAFGPRFKLLDRNTG